MHLLNYGCQIGHFLKGIYKFKSYVHFKMKSYLVPNAVVKIQVIHFNMILSLSFETIQPQLCIGIAIF